jgi:transposase InsO family protein
MSRATSLGTGKPYGLERVCRVLEFPRSTIYAQEQRQAAQVVAFHPARRGPKPKVSDADLLAAIRADLAASPFAGEGHRKVWARLRLMRDIRVSRARVLRLMREHQLLSPHRRPQGAPTLHDGTITTDRPNEMWGTDGIRIETVDEGWVWVFSAVDHCDAYCVGIHAVKIGNRFAALQPIAQGLKSEFGTTGADAGRGLTLRMDNGTQYTADDFLNQVKFWGIAPSFAFVAEPQTNGVAERFNRTLKEQAIHGRVFRNVEEVRVAVTAFKDRYNRHWRLEKLGFMSPLEARQAYAMRKAA